MSTTTLPSFAHISITEISQLLKAEAPASVLAVWTVLASFDYKKNGYCFPKISTIKKMLESAGGSFREGKVYWALAWLEEKGFLKRNGRRSRQRFDLQLRRDSFEQDSRTSDPSEYSEDKPPTDDSRRENLRNRELSPPQTPPQREGARQKGRKARKREEQQRINTQLAHSKALTAYCEEVAGYLWIKDRPDLSHLSNPTPTPMGCFTLTELKNEVQHHNSLSYQEVGRQKIWHWIKQNHK
jgi:hypothetical protein